MDVVRNRMTNRAFAPAEIPRAHFELILEAARHAPSGANAQPWHYVVVTDPAVKDAIGQCFVDEQQRRARLRMGFPTPDYRGVKTAPGLIVIVADFRFVRAFPVLNDGSELDRLYRQNAERILLQSVAASTMSAHLAAAALGYAVWWITAIGQEEIQQRCGPCSACPSRSRSSTSCASAHPPRPPTSAGRSGSTRSCTGAASTPPRSCRTPRSTSGSGRSATRSCTATPRGWIEGFLGTGRERFEASGPPPIRGTMTTTPESSQQHLYAHRLPLP